PRQNGYCVPHLAPPVWRGCCARLIGLYTVLPPNWREALALRSSRAQHLRGAAQGVKPMADVKRALDGIRVIDLGRHQAGPRCAQVLARLGAEVIKIERLGGEETRYHGPYVRKQSAYWVQYNSGKKSLSMDLRKDEGKEALRKLIKISDVVVQNFRPGTIDEL